MTKIIAFVNQKGGVGKTTTSVNLATAFAAIKKKTLLIDLDPQGNCTTSFGLNPAEGEPTIYNALVESCDLSKIMKETEVPCLYLLPSNMNLSAAEVELAGFKRRERVLSDILDKCVDKFDYILIDCPPSLSLLTINALVAAKSVIIPLQCEFLALEGLSHLIKTLKLLKKRIRPELTMEGVVLTMYDRRNNISEQIEKDVRSYFGDKVYTTVIPRNVRLSEAPSHGKPAILYDLHCTGSQAYIKLAKEILERNAALVEEGQ